MNPRTFAIVNGSCNRREEEIAAVRRFLVANGWKEDGQVDRADRVLLFACGGFRINVDEMLASIATLGRQIKNGAELVVGGCLPLTAAESLRKSFGGPTITYADFTALDAFPGIGGRAGTLPRVFGPDASCPPFVDPGLVKTGILRLAGPSLSFLRPLLRRRPTRGLEKIVSRLDRRQRMTISVAGGCSRTCPYCAKRFGFGPMRSKPVDVILRRISEGLERGYGAFDLFADSIGDYGKDLGTDFATLLDRIASFDARFTVGIYDLHPEDFLENFERIIRLCRAGLLHYLYVITESGNERVLKSMHREIDTADLTRKLLAIRDDKSVFMQTAVLVGYPGETDREFEDTLALLQKIDFDNVFVHSYCDMPNTAASRLEGKTSPETMARRLQDIAAAGIKHNASDARREYDHAFSQSQLGR